MKKLFAILAIAAVMTSCKGKKDDKKVEDSTTNTPTTTDVTTTPTDLAPGDVPTFSDPDVTAYVKAYEDYISVYRKAAEGKDLSKFAELGKMGQDLSSKGIAASQKLANNPSDAKKLADYMTARSQELITLSKKLSGQ